MLGSRATRKGVMWSILLNARSLLSGCLPKFFIHGVDLFSLRISKLGNFDISQKPKGAAQRMASPRKVAHRKRYIISFVQYRVWLLCPKRGAL